MVTEQSVDISYFRYLLEVCGNPKLNAGCLAHNDSSCECSYIFDEVHAGGVGQVFVDNGLSIENGGNDAPPKEEAQAYLRLIVEAVNAMPALLDAYEELQVLKGKHGN